MTSKGFCTRGLLLFLIYTDLFKPATSYSVNDANNIYDKLFNQSNYDKRVLPDEPVTVLARYNLQIVHSLDIKSQIMSSAGWFTIAWNDTRLRWTKSSYGNIETIYVPEDLIWHPELIVLNSIDESTMNYGGERKIRISSNGSVRWEPIAILSTLCDMDVTYFPYDSQICEIELISWDFPTVAINLLFLNPTINEGIYSVEGDWEPVDTFQYDYHLYEENLTYTVLSFNIQLKRLPGHYIMLVIFPTILTAVLSFVTFFLPLKSGVRIGYILTVVLSLVVLLSLFSDSLPSSTKNVSVLVTFVMLTLGMAALLVIFTIMIMRLYHKPKRYVAPKCMYTLVRKFRKIKCRTSKINHLDQQKTVKNGQPTEELQCAEKGTPLKPYSNKELAEFFDDFLFVVFTVLYILLIFCIPVILRTAT